MSWVLRNPGSSLKEGLLASLPGSTMVLLDLLAYFVSTACGVGIPAAGKKPRTFKL